MTTIYPCADHMANYYGVPPAQSRDPQERAFERLQRWNQMTADMEAFLREAGPTEGGLARDLMALASKWESHVAEDSSEEWDSGEEAGFSRAANELREVLMEHGLMSVWGTH